MELYSGIMDLRRGIKMRYKSFHDKLGRKFNGKRYERYDYTLLKSRGKKRCKVLRKSGYSCRLVKSKNPDKEYVIYKRKR